MRRLISALIIGLSLFVLPCEGAVTVNAVSTAFDNSNTATSPKDHTGLTIAAGTNRAVVFIITTSLQVPLISGVTWDQGGTNQACALIGTVEADGNAFGHVELWGLVAPTTGNKTLRIAWTAGAMDVGVFGVALDGVDQTGSTTTFAHAATNTGDGTAPAVTAAITSATGNIVVAGSANNGGGTYNSVDQTSLYATTAPNFGNGAGARAAGAATVTTTWTMSGNSRWGAIGVDVVADGGGGGGSPPPTGGLNLGGVGR